ncbi:MAG: hypothetical protein ABI471_00505 [Sphingomonas bacterium]
MAEMRPPPPRYRIVEHKGRLIATDTWAENRPPRSGTPPPGSDTAQPRIDTTSARLSDSRRLDLPRARPEPASNGFDALCAALVLAACGGSVDPAGRPILSTLNYFDIKGPRKIVLSPASAQALGRCLTVILTVAVSGIILACLFPGAFIVLAILIGFGASAANTAARPAITHWLDRLNES